MVNFNADGTLSRKSYVSARTSAGNGFLLLSRRYQPKVTFSKQLISKRQAYEQFTVP